MNNTSSNKLIKKKLKTKSNINKQDESVAAAGTVLQQEQKTPQNEEVVKKKRKIKEICETVAVKTEEPPQQQQTPEEKIKKKKLRVKQFTEVEATGTDLQTCGLSKAEQEKSKTKKKLKVKQSSKKCHGKETEVAVEFAQMAPKQENEEIVTKKTVKDSSIIPAETTVISHHSQEQQQQLQQQPDLEYYHRKAYIFMRTLKRDYKRLALIYNSCLKAEQEREQRNVQEIDELKRQYNQIQVERTNIKRKRWCRYCESEATYLSTMGVNFYCSQSCEQKQNDLVSAMEGSFKY